jgi:hypothetical protein
MEKYLLQVPQLQKQWFEQHYGDIFNRKELENSCHIKSLNVLINNIFGDYDRFITYKGDSQDLLDDIWLEYSSGKSGEELMQYYLDCLLMVLFDASELDYFEICHNIQLIHIEASNYIEYGKIQLKSLQERYSITKGI